MMAKHKSRTRSKKDYLLYLEYLVALARRTDDHIPRNLGRYPLGVLNCVPDPSSVRRK